jgi:hypothetical protein
MYVPLLGKIPTTSGSCLFRRMEVVRCERWDVNGEMWTVKSRSFKSGLLRSTSKIRTGKEWLVRDGRWEANWWEVNRWRVTGEECLVKRDWWRGTGEEGLVKSVWWRGTGEEELVKRDWWRGTGEEWLVKSDWWGVNGEEWLVESDWWRVNGED